MKILLTSFLLLTMTNMAFAQWSSGNIYTDVYRNTRDIYNLKQENIELRNKNTALQTKVDELEARLVVIERRLNPARQYHCELTLTDSSSYRANRITYTGVGRTEATARAALRTQCLDARVFRPVQCNAEPICYLK